MSRKISTHFSLSRSHGQYLNNRKPETGLFIEICFRISYARRGRPAHADRPIHDRCAAGGLSERPPQAALHLKKADTKPPITPSARYLPSLRETGLTKPGSKVLSFLCFYTPKCINKLRETALQAISGSEVLSFYPVSPLLCRTIFFQQPITGHSCTFQGHFTKKR